MKKLLIYGSIGIAVSPVFVFAAYNDVTLTTSVSFLADGQTINVSGSTNVVEQIVVDAGTIKFTLDTNSEVKITSASGKKLEHNAAAAHVVSTKCESGDSSISLKGASDNVAVIITPKNTTCPEGGGSGGTSGGGGGSSATTVTVSTPATNPTIESLQAQLKVLLEQLAALQNMPVSAKVNSITANLSSGSRGASVKSLQEFLNAKGFTVALSGPGSPGNETDRFGPLTVKAVQKFQEKYGIAKPGEPGYGRVGPKTRAKINELMGN